MKYFKYNCLILLILLILSLSKFKGKRENMKFNEKCDTKPVKKARKTKVVRSDPPPKRRSDLPPKMRRESSTDDVSKIECIYAVRKKFENDLKYELQEAERIEVERAHRDAVAKMNRESEVDGSIPKLIRV